MSNDKGNKRRCPICGFRVRGSNHEKGKHHLEKYRKGRFVPPPLKRYQ